MPSILMSRLKHEQYGKLPKIPKAPSNDKNCIDALNSEMPRRWLKELR